MDRQRDHKRALLADATLRERLTKIDGEFWVSAERRAIQKAELEQRIAKREVRRAMEYKRYGAYVRPGAWDDDLDNYPAGKYEEEIGDGYKIRLVRTMEDYTWNAYVILPAGHCAIGRHYDFFSQEAPKDFPSPPHYLTYGGVNPRGDSWRQAEVGVYGFYLSNTVKPYEAYYDYRTSDFFSAEETGYDKVYGSYYVTYDKMRKMAVELADYFKALAADPKVAAICRTAKRCAEHRIYYTTPACEHCVPPPKKSWAAIVKGK